MWDDLHRQRLAQILAIQLGFIVTNIAKYDQLLDSATKGFIIINVEIGSAQTFVITPRTLANLKHAAFERFHSLLVLGEGDLARAIIDRHARQVTEAQRDEDQSLSK